jgi:hypothetical protein
MSDKIQRAIELIRRAAADGFHSVHLRTDRLTPGGAARVIRQLPSDAQFDSEKIALQVERLPAGTGEGVQLIKSAAQAVLAVSIPGPARAAFDWAEALQSSTSASGIKMNFGPGKATDVRAFWGKPEVNTLVEIGGDEQPD